MASLKDAVVARTLDKVRVVYLDRATSKWWNERRRADDTAAFCGWFWVNGKKEAGPFKTRSAALRDAYYVFVLQREPPSIGHSMLPGFQRETSKGPK